MRYKWHPASRVFLPDGSELARAALGTKDQSLFLPETPLLSTLPRIFHAAETGQEFCVCSAGQQINTDAVAAVSDHLQCMTSGSTGAPKTIRRHQQSWIDSFDLHARFWGISPNDSTATLGALSHSLTLYAAMEATYMGADLHMLTGLRPGTQFDRLAGVSVLYATPTQLRRLALSPSQAHSKMRLLLVGGGKLGPATATRIKQMFPNAALHIFYGASETSFISLSDKTTPEGSVGRAYPDVQIEIRDPDLNGVGEIWVNSPYLFSGYGQGMSVDTRWDDKWLTVGEMGHIDKAGYLWLSGRKSRMFTVADTNVFPEAVEDWLMTQPGVQNAAVLPMPDSQRGQVPVVFMSGTVDLERLQQTARATLGPIQTPRKFWHLSEWPTLPAGKTDYQKLAQLLAHRT